MNAKVVGAGVFVVLGVLLFTGALFMIGERRMLFEERFPLYTEFARLGQLEDGAIVRVAGADAGEITEIAVPTGPAGKFRVRMEVREALHPLIRTDSLATTQTDGLVGNVFVNIATGSEQQPQIQAEGTIPSKEPFSMSDLLAQMSETVMTVNTTVEALRGDVQTAFMEVAQTAGEAHAMFTDIRPDFTMMARNGARISADAQQVIAGIREGRGSLGKLMNDDDLYVRLRDISTQAQVVVGNVRDATGEAKRAISDFRSKDGPAQGLLSEMRVTVGQAREATADLADNMEAMKHNFLLRGFFNRRGYFDLGAISPADYRSGVLENGKRKAMRIWLANTSIFEAGPDGIEVLSEGGRARVDSAMATYLQYLPSNPLIVEGYATVGTTEERFRHARQRAGVVREYVMGRYQLSPQNTGFIGLGAEAPGSPEHERWDGVAVTLFLDRAELQFISARPAR